MENFDAVKILWQKKSRGSGTELLDIAGFEQLVQASVQKENRKTLHYFWGAFVYQNILYGLTAALIVKNFYDFRIWIPCLCLSLLYVPFTVILMKRFKKINGSTFGNTLTENLQFRYDQLSGFFRFKKVYEMIAVPVACALITFIIFQLWVPGDWKSQIPALAACWIVAVFAFAWAILRENRDHFRAPLTTLAGILAELKENSSR